jgi:hypothetical protein
MRADLPVLRDATVSAAAGRSSPHPAAIADGFIQVSSLPKTPALIQVSGMQAGQSQCATQGTGRVLTPAAGGRNGT